MWSTTVRQFCTGSSIYVLEFVIHEAILDDTNLSDLNVYRPCKVFSFPGLLTTYIVGILDQERQQRA